MNTRLLILMISLLCASSTTIYAQSTGNAQHYRTNNFAPVQQFYQSEQVIKDHRLNSYNSEPHLAGTGNNNVALTAKALMNVKADHYVAVFSITQLGENAQTTDALMNQRISGFTNQLKQLGIKPTDIYIDMISMVPVYEVEVEKKLFSKTFNEVPKGFQMQKNVHIQFTKSGLLDKIITAGAQQEIYDIVKVDYYISNTAAIYDTLRARAIALINQKKESFKDIGMNLDQEYQLFSEKNTVYYPFERYSSYNASSRQSIEAIKKKSGVKKVQSAKTLFYQPVSMKYYDIVINPVVNEPVIQYSYQLKVEYHLPHPPQPDNQYLIITPNGDLKELNID